MELIKNDVRIELEDIGEGECGEYDENDPNDTPYLRFYTQVRGGLAKQYTAGILSYSVDETAWRDLPRGSYCTRIPATASEEVQKAFLEELMSRSYDAITRIEGYKRILEEATWLTPDDLTKTRL